MHSISSRPWHLCSRQIARLHCANGRHRSWRSCCAALTFPSTCACRVSRALGLCRPVHALTEGHGPCSCQTVAGGDGPADARRGPASRQARMPVLCQLLPPPLPRGVRPQGDLGHSAHRADALPLALRRCLAEDRRLWDRVQLAKQACLQVWEGTKIGGKIASVKAVQRIIETQTRGTSDPRVSAVPRAMTAGRLTCGASFATRQRPT